MENGNIYYGFGGIKGIGEVADAIKAEREANGRFTSFADFMARVGAKSLNRKVLEQLARAGAFSDFTELHRAAYFYIAPGEKMNFIEKSIKQVNASNERKNNAQIDLFGELEAAGGDDMFKLLLRHKSIFFNQISERVPNATVANRIVQCPFVCPVVEYQNVG